MNCKKEGCGGTLVQVNVDSRGEWTEFYLECDECGAEYVRRQDYDQDGLVISDKIYPEDE